MELFSSDCYDKDRKELPTEGDDAIDLEKMFTKGTVFNQFLNVMDYGPARLVGVVPGEQNKSN